MAWPDVLNVLMRWLHISSVAVAIGGMLYAWRIVTPALASLPADLRARVSDDLAARFRPFAYAIMAALLISGIYKLLITPGHTRRYHVLLGIKLLLVLHVFTTALLVVGTTGAGKRPRRMAGIAISGLIIILISAYLSRIF